MDILKAFSLTDGKSHNINIQGTPDDPLFPENQIGNLLGVSCIRSTTRNIDCDELRIVQDSYTVGGFQKIAFLTEAGLYHVLSRSNKPIAQKFQIWMVGVLKEIRKTGEYKLKQQNEIDRQLLIQKNKVDLHKKYLELFHKKNVVYLCKIKHEEDNKFIIKIGSTQNIKERVANITNNYSVIPIIIDIFECSNHTKFESWIRAHESIKSLYHRFQKKDGTISRETFLVTEQDYNTIILLIKERIDGFIENRERILELELKQTEVSTRLAIAEIEKRKLDLEIIRELQKNETPIIQQYENKLESPPIEVTQMQQNNNVNFVKKRVNKRSPKVYQYDPETLELTKIYDNIIDVIRDIQGSCVTQLKDSVENNAVYRNYRWMFSNKSDTEMPIPPPTERTKQISIEYIAMIDIKKTHIISVFPSQKEAAEARNLSGFSTISRAIKQGTPSSGHYWNSFNNCSQEMKDEYLKKNSLPEKHVHASSVSVKQIDPITNNEIKTFNSVTDVILQFQMSRTSLKRASDNDTVHNGFKWKMIKTTK
jgi:prophage antirepressor-like protein